ncbi:hypothetical protein BGP76_02140 [Reichenbachiella sp. MSK19-1]|nr:hypothetical protein BGP76_02140 [Reichenbachiella sp. MSK19-1]
MAQSPAIDFEQKLSSYLEIQNRQVGFNGIVTIVDGEGHMLEKEIGLASRELEVPIRSNTKFKIASMTKSFTALLVSLAEQEGKLTLDDKIISYFHNLPNEEWKRVTIRQLMSHTSGIPHWKGIEGYWTEKSLIPLNHEQILAEFFNMELEFDPGSKFGYSSPGYYLLASILEDVYSDSFENILQTKILSKLNMDATGIYNGHSILSNMSSGYHLISDNVIMAPPRNMASMKGGGNMYSTSADMTKWCRSFLTTAYWGEDLITRSFQPMTDHENPQKESKYGRGWYLTDNGENQIKTFHLGGGTYGYSCNAAIYPDERFSIVIMSNMSFLPTDNIRKDIEKIVFGLPFEMPKDFGEEIQLSVEQLEHLAGRYQAENGMVLLTIIHQRSLYAKLGSNPPLKLFATDELNFTAQKVNIQFVFQSDESNKITGLKTEGRGRIDYFQKQ